MYNIIHKLLFKSNHKYINLSDNYQLPFPVGMFILLHNPLSQPPMYTV